MPSSRARRPPFETAVFRLTGMDVKLEQYRLGERFADAVASRQGMEGLNRVWEGPENLPTLAEVRDPGLWMTRMRSEEHTSELQSRQYLVCRLLLEKKKKI